MNKSDPMYYKIKIEQLIKQARESGLEMSLSNNGFQYKVNFKSDNGECCGAILMDYREEKEKEQ